MDLFIEKVELESDKIKIRWNSEAKQSDSILPLQFMIENYPSNDVALNEPYESFKPCKVNR